MKISIALFTFGLHNKIVESMYVLCFTQGSFLFWHKASYVPFCPLKCLNCLDQWKKSFFFQMQSFLTGLMKVYFHTIMVYTSVAAVLPKAAFFFGTRRHMFRLVHLNAFTAQIREYKIIFFFKFKVSLHDYGKFIFIQ